VLRYEFFLEQPLQVSGIRGTVLIEGKRIDLARKSWKLCKVLLVVYDFPKQDEAQSRVEGNYGYNEWKEVWTTSGYLDGKER